MYQVVRDWADRTPEAPAILRDGNDALCYRDLLTIIESIGTQLDAVGIGRNDRVAIVHPEGPETAVAILGIWSYATAVPMNPNYTVGEFAVYLQDMGVKAVVVPAGVDTPVRTAADRMQLMLLELTSDRIGATLTATGTDCARPAPGRTGPAHIDDTATVLVTSGTTANAKIVPLTHRQLVGRGRLNAGFLALTAQDRALSLMPLFHGGGQSAGLASCLYAGGSVCPPSSLDADSFYRYLQRIRPTYAMGAPAIFHNIRMQAERYEAVIVESRAHLRMIRTGAGHLDHGLAHWLETTFDAPVIQVYGSSEAGWMACDPIPPAVRKSGSVGVSRPNEVKVMDPQGRLVPPGTAGEIVARGDVVFDGYENDAAATAGAFVEGWFRTGDEGYFDDDGYLFLTGRIKEIINRGGEKVTPTEVDDALLAHPAVRLAATFPMAHPTLGEEVAAAVVLEPGAAVSASALSGFVRERLAGFKAPRRVVFVADIPKGPTGKIQRRTLAAALGLDSDGATAEAGNGSSSRAPSAMEARLSVLWAEALGLEDVGLDEDFFLLGGDSLQAVELFLRVEKAFGQRLPRSVLFEAGTVSEMAKRIAAAVRPPCLVALRTVGGRPPFFCVHGGTGDVLPFRELARHLGPDQPFYAIQAGDMAGSSGPHVRIEAMAADYIGEMRKVQPSGPYYLGGYSFGGRVALVMARQLRDAGEAVGLLALLEPYSRLGRLRVLGPWLDRRWAMPRFLRRPAGALGLARADSRLAPYAGSAVLFQAARGIRTHADAYAGWRTLVAGGLEVHPLPCRRHEIMEEPYVQELARELAARLNGDMPGVMPASAAPLPDAPPPSAAYARRR